MNILSTAALHSNHFSLNIITITVFRPSVLNSRRYEILISKVYDCNGDHISELAKVARKEIAFPLWRATESRCCWCSSCIVVVVVAYHLRTVDNAKYSPEKENDNKCKSFFALSPSDALHEHQIQSERRRYYCTVEHLPNTNSQPTVFSARQH